jgi:hypothetical protein
MHDEGTGLQNQSCSEGREREMRISKNVRKAAHIAETNGDHIYGRRLSESYNHEMSKGKCIVVICVDQWVYLT